jgi:GGDEF domain-containing protein
MLRLSKHVLALALILGALIAPASADERRQTLIAPGGPAYVVGPRDADSMVVTAGGFSEHSGGRWPVASSSLGHSVDVVSLPHDLARGTRITVTIEPANAGAARIEIDDNAPHNLVRSGRVAGAMFGMLFALFVLLGASLLVIREPTIRWYAAYLLAIAFTELLREGMLPWRGDRAEHVLLLAELLIGVIAAGFAAVFLRLTEARPLLNAVIAVAIPFVIINAIAVIFPPARLYIEGFRTTLLAIGLVALMIVTGLRAAYGFTPGWWLLAALAAYAPNLVYRVVRSSGGGYSPFLDRWFFETCIAAHVLLFAVAIIVRASFVRTERKAVVDDLLGAQREAHHDRLTGMLNRRGLGAYQPYAAPNGTLYVIVLHNLRKITDTYGHTAADIVLRELSAVLGEIGGPDAVVARIDTNIFALVDDSNGVAAAAMAQTVVRELELLAPLRALPEVHVAVAIGYTSLRNLVLANAIKIATESAARYRQTRSAAPL